MGLDASWMVTFWYTAANAVSIPAAVAGQRGHRGVRLVHPEQVQLLGERGERAGQQRGVIQHRPA